MYTSKRILLFILIVIVFLLGLGFYQIGNRTKALIIDDLEIPLGLEMAFDVTSEKTLHSLSEMEGFVAEQLQTSNKQKINQVLMAFMRKDAYGYDTYTPMNIVWARFAGQLKTESKIDLSKPDTLTRYKKVIDWVGEIGPFKETTAYKALNFSRMISVIDIQLTDVMTRDSEELYYDVLFTWGMELESFITQVIKNQVSIDKQSISALFADETSGYLTPYDWLAVVDGINIAHMITNEDFLLSEALEAYYLEGRVLDRYTLFVAHYGGEEALEEIVTCFIVGILPKALIKSPSFIDIREELEAFKTIIIKDYVDAEHVTTINLRKIVSEVFIEVLVD